MKPILKTTLIAALLLCGIQLNAQQAFSLKEAQEYALINSYMAKDADMEVTKAKKKVNETTAIGLPQINGSVNYQNYLEIPVQLIDAAAFGGTPGTFEEVSFAVDQSIRAGVTADQIIFDGSYIVALQASKTFLDISRNSKIKTEIEIKDAITQAYGMVLVAERNEKIMEENKTNLEKTLFETSELFKNGFAEEQDVDQLKLLVANIANQYNNAKRQVDIAYNLLKFQMGIDIANDITLTEELDKMIGFSGDATVLDKQFDHTTHIDYRIMENQERSNVLLLRNEKMAYAPRLSAFITYEQNSFANDFNFFGSDAQWFPSSYFGLNLSVPIFSSLSRHNKVQQAKIDLDQTRLQKIQVEQSLKMEAETAKSDYAFALDQYNTQQENLALALRIKTKTEIKYNEGLSTSLELTQAQNQYLETQGNYINSIFQLITAKSKLDKALNNY